MNEEVRRRPSSTVSLCCITAGPLRRVAAIFSLYRPHVDEIVCAVNARFRADELAVLDGLADRVIPVEMGGDFLQERYRPWLYAQCRGDWILTTDSDEVPGGEFLACLPTLTANDHVVTHIVPCRWVFPDGGHYLDEFPWEPSWKLVLVRNDRASLQLRSGVHEGVVASEPYRYEDLPIYHLDCLLRPYDKRREKVAFYDELDGVQLMEDGRPVSAVYYLPEDHAVHPQAAIPPADAANVAAVLAADTGGERVLEWEPGAAEAPLLPGAVRLEEVEALAPDRPLREGDYRAELRLVPRARSPRRDPRRFVVGEARPFIVRLANTSGRTWGRGGANDIFLGSRWFAAGSGSDEATSEGPRSAFTADVDPGERLLQPIVVQAPGTPGAYRLVIDLVHEHVAWFACGVELDVEVAAPDDAGGGLSAPFERPAEAGVAEAGVAEAASP